MATWAETRARLKKEEENKRTWADVKSERENGTGVFGDYESVTTANAMAEYRYTQALKSLEEERKKESKINKAVKRTGISSLSDSKRMGAQRYSIALDDDIKTQGNRQSAINDYYNTGKQSSYLKNMLKSTGGTKDTPADTRMVALEKREKGKIDVLQSQKRDLQKYNKQSLPSGFKTDDLREQLKEVENKIAIIENSESEDVPVAGYQGILDSYGGKDTPNATKAEVALKDLYNQKYELDNALSVYDQRMKAQEIFTTADYAEKSKANPNEKNDLYRVINNIDGQQVWRRGNADLQKYVGTLSQDEIGVFNYIFATEGEEAAQAYLNSIDVDTRKAAQTQENVREFAENAPVASWFLNRVTKPFVSGAYAIQQGVSSAGNYIGSVAGRTQDEYGGYVTPQTELSTPIGLAQLSAETIDTVGTEKAEDAGGPLGSLLYQAGTSGIDSAVAGLLSGGNPAAISAIMSGESTASTILQNKMEGKSDSEALLKGVIAGSIEALTERFSVEMIMKDPTNTLGSYLKAFVAEGSEEVTNNWLNRFADSITDSWVGRENEFNAEVENKMASGQNVFEAMANTFGENLPDYLVEDLESFVVGGTSGLGFNVVGNITNGSFSQIGKSVRAAGSEQFYLDQARAMPETTEAHQLAVKWREGEVQTNDYVLGQIASGVVEYAQNTEGSHYEAIRAEDNAKTIQDVFKNSEAGKNVNKQALDEIVSEYDPEDGVSAEVYARGALSAYTYGSKGLNIEKFMENDPLSGELKEWQINNAFRLGQVFADAKTDAKAVSDVIRYDVSETGETRVKETAAPVNVQGIESIENGEVILALENGEKVSASTLEFGTKEEAVLYEAVSEFDADAKTANALVQTYKSSDDVFEYADTMQKAYLYGEYNLPIEDLEGEKGASQAQIESIYKLGREYMSKITAPKTVSQTGTGNQAKKGRVVYSGSLNNLNERQRVSISALKRIAAATGIDFALFESPVENGRRTGVNGYYDRSTNKIYIDVYSGVQGNDTILFTAAHELTHFVKEWSPDKFGELAGFLIEQYQKKNVSVISLVQRQREKAKRNGREISYDEAFEEFVADSMETMLADGNIVEKLSALKAKDKTLWEKLRDKIRELVKQIQNVYKGLKADSAEGRYVAEMQEALQRIQDLFAEGVTEASTNYKSTLPDPKKEAVFKDNANSKEYIRYSSRYAEVTIDDYTEKTYNESGWVFVNKLLTSDETKKFSDQFANRLSRKYKDYFPKTKDGYFVFTVGDDNKPQNKFIFAKGTLKNPIIKSVIETDFDEYAIDAIRDFIKNQRGDLFETSYWYYIEYLSREGSSTRYRPSDFESYRSIKWESQKQKVNYSGNAESDRTVQESERSDSSGRKALSSGAKNESGSERQLPRINKNSERDLTQQEEIDQLKSENEELKKDLRDANNKYKRYKGTIDRSKEIAARNKYKERIQRNVDDLTDWILNPSNKTTVNRVPDAIKNPVIEFIDSINFSSKKFLKKGEHTIKDKAMLKKLTALRKVLAENQKLDELYSSYTDLPPDFLDMLDATIQPIQELIAESDGQDFVLNQMESKDLKNLSEVVSKLKKYVKEFNQFHANAMYKHVYEAGDNSVDTMAKMGSATAKRAAVKGANNFVYWKNMRPAYAFERFGKGGEAIYDGLRRGQDKLAFNTKQVTDFSEKTFTPKEVKGWGKEIKEFSLSDGSKIKMPVTHIMGLYELMKRQQGMQHLLGGGFRVATFKDGSKQISDTGHLINQDDLNNIVGSLSKRQIEVADALQNYMGTVGSAWGNEVTVKRFGERLFGEENYYPINSDGRHIPAEADRPADNASLYALLNMGFTKKLEENAKNRVIIYNIFDVFANHMASMAEYNAMALPVLDAIKWFNYKQTKIVDGKTQVIDSVRDEMTRVYGAPAEKSVGSGTKGYAENFVINILKSFNGTENRADPNENLLSKSIGNVNRAAVAFNIRVVVQQPLSILRAALVLDYRSIFPFLRPAPIQVSKAIKEMQEHSGIALWKSLGFYDVNISRSLTSLIKQDDTKFDKFLNKGMWLAEKGDEITWARIWLACKKEVERKYNIAPARPEYFEKVTELFEDVIYKTQVVDSTLTKTEFSRSKSAALKSVSAFMSEPVTTASMLADAIFKYKMDLQSGMSLKQAAIKHKKQIGRVAIVYSFAQIANAAVQAAYDALLRDDEEYADYLEKWVKDFKENLINEFSLLAKYPIAADFRDLIIASISKIFDFDFYVGEPTSLLIPYFDNLTKGTEIIVNKIKNKDESYTLYGGIYKLLQAVSGLIGVPAASLTREAISVWNAIAGNIDPEFKKRTYDPGDEADIKYAYLDGYLTFDEAVNLLLEKEIESNKDDAYFTVTKWEGGEGYTKFGSLYEAVRSNGDVKAAMQEYLDHGYTEKELKSNIKSEIGNWYKDKTIGEDETKEYLKKYTDIESADIEPTLKKWQCKRDTGFSYEQLKSAYLDGEISRSQAQQYLQKYGGKTSSEASNQISGWEEDK